MKKKGTIIAVMLVIAALMVSAGIAVAAGVADSGSANSRKGAAGVKEVRTATANGGGSCECEQSNCPGRGDDNTLRNMNCTENGTGNCEGNGDCVQERSCDRERLQEGSCDGTCDGSGEQSRNQGQGQGFSNQVAGAEQAIAQNADAGSKESGDCDRNKTRLQDRTCEGTCDGSGAQNQNRQNGQSES